MKKFILTALAFIACGNMFAQTDGARLLDKRKINQDYPHGQLPYAMGVHNIQTMRANRERPDLSDGFGWTYNHAPNLAYWNGTFYYHYLSDPHGEHIPSSQTLLQTSRDGYTWAKPMVLFPPYRIPNGFSKQGSDLVAQDIDAVMHQRMGFYVTKDESKLLSLGYYGICLAAKGDSPLDGNGIGRVVREINRDGSFGPIYFIRINHEWNESTVKYPFYKRSKDKAFVAACDELLADPLMMQQWTEEADRNDPLVPIKDANGFNNANLKGFNYTTLPDGRLMSVFKNGVYAISSDKGHTWTPHQRITNIITGSAKCWIQQMSDGTYALVYNPTYYRYPMAVATSSDGMNWDNLRNVHGEVTPMRYSGNEKSWGPQYLRGIMPGNGTPPDGNMWLAYSVNKEDMWAMRVTAPLLDAEVNHVNEDLTQYDRLSQLDRWNIYSPLWAPVSIEQVALPGQESNQRTSVLRLADWDPYDYAKAERFFPESEVITVEFSVIPVQNNTGALCVELQNSENYAATRVTFDADGRIRLKRNYKSADLGAYEPGQTYTIKLEANAKTQQVAASVNGKRPSNNTLYGQVDNFSKVVFRTGELIRDLNVDTDPFGEWVAPEISTPVDPALFYVLSVKTQ